MNIPLLSTFTLAAVWSEKLVRYTVDIALVIIVIGMLLCIWRLLRGPHLADRAMAVDTLAVQLIGLVILLSVRWQTLWFIDGILVLSLLGFAGTVAMAQYIARHQPGPRPAIKSLQNPDNKSNA